MKNILPIVAFILVIVFSLGSESQTCLSTPPNYSSSINQDVADNIRAIADEGYYLGRDSNVFMVVGDSISGRGQWLLFR
jgi:hypothetical protein